MIELNTICIDVPGVPGWVWECRKATPLMYLLFDSFTRTTPESRLRLADWSGSSGGIIVLKHWGKQ